MAPRIYNKTRIIFVLFCIGILLLFQLRNIYTNKAADEKERQQQQSMMAIKVSKCLDLERSKRGQPCQEQRNESNLNECYGEKMAYELKMNDSRIIYGKKFNCSLIWLLDRYKLSDKHALKGKIQVKYPGHPKFMFVTAANDIYYPQLRALLASIKDKFGCQQRIIAYDLGTITQNKKWMKELDSVCSLEWRLFNFSQMVNNTRVRNPKSYAWKLFVIAHVLTEYDTVVWLDSSIEFESDNLAKFLTPIQNGTIFSVQVPSFSSHGMYMATHPGMFKFLPMYTAFEPKKEYALTRNTDPPQFETNFVILHKTEQTRQLMKWALLCAAEPDCIVPRGQTKQCIYTPIAANLTCNRQDQSLVEILRYNMEYRQEIEDPSNFLPQLSANHPRSMQMPMKMGCIDELFKVRRGQLFNGTVADWLQKVECC